MKRSGDENRPRPFLNVMQRSLEIRLEHNVGAHVFDGPALHQRNRRRNGQREAVHQWPERIQHRPPVLVVANADQGMERSANGPARFGDRLGHDAHPIRIVRHIEDPLAAHLEPAGDIRVREAHREVLAHRPERRGQRVQHGVRHQRVGHLMPSAQPKLGVLPRPQRRVYGYDRVGTAPLCLFDELRADVGIGFASHERHLRFGNPRLFPRDALEVAAEVLDVLEGDLRDGADQRGEDVRRVEPAAEPHFDHCDIDVSGGEVGEGDGGRCLEEAGLEPLDMRFEPGRPFGKGVFADRDAVDGDPLTRGDEVGGGVEPDAPPLCPQLIGHESGRGSLAVGAADVDGRKVPLGMAQHVEQPLGRAEAPFDAGRLSCEKKLAGVFEGQSAASAGQEPVMWRSSCAAVSRSSPRGTTASIIPWSNRNSAVWNPSGRSWPIVCLITRGPANPMTAPGSARITSPCIAYDAETPPVVGFVSTDMNGTPAPCSSAMTTDVLAICISDSTPSCMRAPPEAETRISGERLSMAWRVRRAIFSPTTDPIEPPMKLKSMTPRLIAIPCKRAYPVRIASNGPAFLTAACTRST